MATRISTGAKAQIIDILREQGYPRYANLVSLFDIYLTDDSDVVGYMIPGKAKIVINENLNIYQVSVIVRHEVLHEYFTHGPRTNTFNKQHPEFNGGNHELSNIAADFEISNRGYTLDDKANVRSIKLNGQLLKGLVTEDHYPEWQGLTFEEMYHKLLKERSATQNSLEQLLQQMSKLSKKEMEDLEDILDKMERATEREGQESTSSATSTKTPPKPSTPSTPTTSESDRIDELQKEVGELKDTLQDVQSSKNGTRPSDEFALPKDQRAEADVAARVEQIRRELQSMDAFDEVMKETSAAKRKENVARAKRNAVSNYAKSGNGGLKDFELDLKRFVSREVSQERERTWNRPDSRYKRRGFLVAGRQQVLDETIPVINVYWDTSGSFSNPAKTAAARAAIDSIQSYVKKGLIEVNVYYHSNDVYDHPVSGGNDGDNVVKHIKETHPDNVIIITDGDLSNTRANVKVPGAVWFLFYDYISQGLIDNVSGRKQSKWYMVKY